MEEIAIIIPVYNEEAALPEVLRQAEELLASESIRFHFILVNDGSTDGSVHILKDMEGRAGYTVLKHYENRGYGAALKTGLRQTTIPYVGMVDADGTYPVNKLPELFACLRAGGYAMVVGDRSGCCLPGSFWRRGARWFLTGLANYLTGRAIPDLNSGLRIMEREQVERFLHILPDGFSFTSTITLAMLTNHLPVQYLPVSYFSRVGASKIRPIHDAFNFLQLILRTAMYFRPLKVFGLLSGLLLLAALLVLGGSYLWAGKIMDVTFGVLILSAVMVLMIGMLADLIVQKTE